MESGVANGPPLDIEKATRRELLKEYKSCEDLWSKYSCDCFGFYMDALHKKIVEHSGWPVRRKQ